MKFDDFVYKKKSGRSCHFPTVIKLTCFYFLLLMETGRPYEVTSAQNQQPSQFNPSSELRGCKSLHQKFSNFGFFKKKLLIQYQNQLKHKDLCCKQNYKKSREKRRFDMSLVQFFKTFKKSLQSASLVTYTFPPLFDSYIASKVYMKSFLVDIKE